MASKGLKPTSSLSDCDLYGIKMVMSNGPTWLMFVQPICAHNPWKLCVQDTILVIILKKWRHIVNKKRNLYIYNQKKNMQILFLNTIKILTIVV